MHISLKVPSQYFCWLMVWTLTEPLHLDSFYSRFAGVLGIIVVTQLGPSFRCQTNGLTFCYTEELLVDSVTVRCPGPEAAKQAQIITPPPPCLMVDIRCLC